MELAGARCWNIRPRGEVVDASPRKMEGLQQLPSALSSHPSG